MPSAAVKGEQKFQDGMEPMKQVLVLIEKKVRNLEKRKGKLEDYKAKESKGGLTEEQKNACSRLDEVNQHLEMAKELQKQFTAVSQEAEKNLKRQLKKEKLERHEEERKRFNEVLQFKSLVDHLRTDPARSAFLQGVEGATKVTDEEFSVLEDFYKLVFAEKTKEEIFKENVHQSSEHLQNLLDSKDKAINGLQTTVSYKELKDLLKKMEQSPYFVGVTEVPDVKENQEDACTNSTADQDTAEKTDVPAHETAEVAAPLPALADERIPEPFQQPEDQYPIDETITIYNQYIGKAFQDIVSSGTFNFLQDSLIDIDTPAHSDPAVLHVLPQPNMYSGSHTGNNVGFGNSSAYSTYSPAPPDQAYPPDAPQPIPLPNHDGNVTDDSKLFTMNADAPAFETKTQAEGDNENGLENEGFYQTGRNNRGRFQNNGRGRGRINGFRNGNSRGGNSRGSHTYQPRPSDYHSDNTQSLNGGGPNHRRGSGGPRGYGPRDFSPRGSWRGNGSRGARGNYHHNDSHQRVEADA